MSGADRRVGMSGFAAHTLGHRTRSAILRLSGFFLAWLVLSATGWAELYVGLAAALIATGVSLALLPPRGGRLNSLLVARYALHFIVQSIIAGIDVGRRALDPRLPLNPGFIRYRVALPRGAARNAFTMLMSMLPGTVPTGPDEHDALVVHCLDVSQPVAAQLAAEEAMINEIWRSDRG